MFGLNRSLRVYFDLYAPDIPKTTSIMKNLLTKLVWKSVINLSAQNISSKSCIQKVNSAVKHLSPCFLTISVKKTALKGCFWKIGGDF